MSNIPAFQFSSNIHSTRSLDPRRHISSSSHNNLEIAQFWEDARRTRQNTARPPSAEVQPKRPETRPEGAHRKDHLREMWDGIKYQKQPVTSSYRQVFEHTTEKQEELDTKDRTNFKKKDWLKGYFENVHRHKHFVR